MKKLTRMIAIVLALTLALGTLTGCGGKKEDTQTPAVNDTGSPSGNYSLYPDPVPDSSEDGLKDANQVARTLHDYSTVGSGYQDGYLWLRGKDALGESHYVCIDNSGTATAILPATLTVGSLHHTGGGYAYYMSNNIWTVVDYTGTVRSTYTLDNDHELQSYGDGYTAILNKPAGFNATQYSVTIYGPDWETLAEIPLEGNYNYNSGFDNIKYYGKGVFCVNAYEDEQYNICCQLYFMESGKLITLVSGKRGAQSTLYADFSAGNTYGFAYIEADGRLDITAFDANGNTKLIPFEHGFLAVDIRFNDSGYTFSYRDDAWNIDKAVYISGRCSIDVNNGVIYQLDDQYRQKAEDYIVCDGFVAVKMWGDDGNSYVALFDNQWNILLEPVRVDSEYTFTDGVLCVVCNNELTAYNESGAKLFSVPVPTEDTSAIAPYIFSDGVLIFHRSGTVLDKSGNTLFTFDQIDTSRAVVVEP